MQPPGSSGPSDLPWTLKTAGQAVSLNISRKHSRGFSRSRSHNHDRDNSTLGQAGEHALGCPQADSASCATLEETSLKKRRRAWSSSLHTVPRTTEGGTKKEAPGYCTEKPCYSYACTKQTLQEERSHFGDLFVTLKAPTTPSTTPTTM